MHLIKVDNGFVDINNPVEIFDENEIVSEGILSQEKTFICTLLHKKPNPFK